MDRPDEPLVSILLPYRNAQATLVEALESILGERAIPLELVATDDGSTDGSAQIVSAIAASDPRVVRIATGGVGIAKALALAHAHAKAPFLARMDADDISLPGRLKAQLDLLRTNPKLGVVGTRVEPFPKEHVAEGLDRYVAWQNSLVSPEEHAAQIFVEAPLCHPTAMLRRSALEAVGGFRDVAWAEDYDLWLRLHAAGYEIAKVPEILFRWRHHGGRATFRDGRYSLAMFTEARAHYLAPHVLRDGRALVVWGAGPTGKRLMRALERYGVRASAFVDIDPDKIGRVARGVPILAPQTIQKDKHLVVVAVGARGARDEIRPHLRGRSLVEGADFICAA